MRCLVVADLHYSLPQFDWLLSAAPHFDLVIFAGDALFTVCPWWDGPLVKQRIDEQLREAAAGRLQRWIWVHHAPPANSPTSWGGKRFFGDVELVQWIESYQPSMVISGHVHQSPFIPDGSWFDRLGGTWVFNPGLQPGRPPAHIVLDIEYRVLAAARRRAMHRPQRAIAAAGRADQQSAGVAYILGSDCRSEPGEILIGGRLIMLCRISPTIAR